jgi:hypothetical protein
MDVAVVVLDLGGAVSSHRLHALVAGIAFEALRLAQISPVTGKPELCEVGVPAIVVDPGPGGGVGPVDHATLSPKAFDVVAKPVAIGRIADVVCPLVGARGDRELREGICALGQVGLLDRA